MFGYILRVLKIDVDVLRQLNFLNILTVLCDVMLWYNIFVGISSLFPFQFFSKFKIKINEYSPMRGEKQLQNNKYNNEPHPGLQGSSGI